MAGERLLLTSEAAEFLGISRHTLARWVDRGLIKPAQMMPPASRGGRMSSEYRWRLAELRAFKARMELRE